MANTVFNTKDVKSKKKSNKIHLGTISGFELQKNRAGKINLGNNPEIRASVFKDKSVYDRKSSKHMLHKEIKGH